MRLDPETESGPVVSTVISVAPMPSAVAKMVTGMSKVSPGPATRGSDGRTMIFSRTGTEASALP